MYLVQGSEEFPGRCLLSRLYDITFTGFTFLKPIIIAVTNKNICQNAEIWYTDAVDAGLLDRKFKSLVAERRSVMKMKSKVSEPFIPYCD